MAIRKMPQPEAKAEKEEKEVVKEVKEIKEVKEAKPKLKDYTVKAMLNFREGPSKDHKVLQVLKAGDVVNVESIEGKWAKCYFNKKPGYVMTDYIVAK